MNPQRLPACCALHVVAEVAALLRALQDSAHLRQALVTRFGLCTLTDTGVMGQTQTLAAVFNLVWTHIGEHDNSDH